MTFRAQSSLRNTTAALAPAVCAIVLVLLLGATGILTAVDRAWFESLQHLFTGRSSGREQIARSLVEGHSLRALVAMLLAVALISFAARKGTGPMRLAILSASLLAIATGGGAALFVLGGVWFAPAPIVAGVIFGFGIESASGVFRARKKKREIQGWLGAHVPPAMVKKIMQNPEAFTLGGERRELTVLFSGIANFTALSERLSSTQLVSLVNTCLHELSECVIAHGGYIDKYIGGALMAVFGAPEPLGNDALCACRAALESRRRLDVINERIEIEYGERLGIRIGINTGGMALGNVGSEKMKNYTVLGDAVSIAARLANANKEFGTGVLIGPLTAQRVHCLMAARPVALLRAKGKPAAIKAHELIGEMTAISASQRAYLQACADGFDAWCAHRFGPASEAFAHAVMLRPDDAVSARYHEISLNLSARPPAPDWTPIIELPNN
ncbi:class 3 adenylate cyclase [Ereboglobus sp. PH5-5]|uniref:adenylate/guanylate cyclase domain-containing protein n=1 Tax=Ereboglobus sp. PH5-5 TaxID=2940529 RepID=UPI0024052DB4|nr:adenylate/guanylate cyclase domain-containing protein [Ereboglobus sp. PH5-5]MDF9833572.1 class 3 adenylate cyclase [Ereboglobus sp. PH5-5]